MLTSTFPVNSLSTYSSYYSARLEVTNSSTQSTADTTNHIYEWEIDGASSETEKLIAETVISTAEKLIGSIDRLTQIDFSKLAKQWGEAAYKEITNTAKTAGLSEIAAVLKEEINNATKDFNQSRTYKFGAKELQVFRASIDDLEGLW